MTANSIAVQLREKRREKRITIVELAEKIGMSQAHYVRIERGEIKPTAEQVELILQDL